MLHCLQDSILKLPQIVAVAFSPGSTLLQTFQRPQKEAGNADKNLKVTKLHGLLTCVIICTVCTRRSKTCSQRMSHCAFAC